MRARYCAFALGEVNFLMDTTHPKSPHHRTDRMAWAAELGAFCAETQFKRLSIVSQSADGNAGHVHFRARFERAGRSAVLEEKSEFIRQEGRWYYLAEMSCQNDGAER